MAKSEGRRAWIKNAAIIFLVVLLLLTFFSNTILNYSLPEVSAQYPQYSTLNTSVKLSGFVKANASYNVIFEEEQADAGMVQSRKVLSVYVKEGMTVEKDQPIMELKGGASQQLDEKQKQYDELKKAYELALLDDKVSGLESNRTISEAERAVADARAELAELTAMQEAVQTGGDTAAVLEAAIERLEEEIAALDEMIADVSAKISELDGKIASAGAVIEEDLFTDLSLGDRLALAEIDYAEAEQTYRSCLIAKGEAEETLNDLRAAQESVSEAANLTASISQQEDSIASLELQVRRYIEDNWTMQHTEAEDLYTADVLTLIEGELELLGEDVLEVSPEAVNYKRQLEDYWLQFNDMTRQLSALKTKLSIIGMPEMSDLSDYAITHYIDSAQQAFDEASAALNEATENYNEAKTRVESLRKQNQSSGLISDYEAERDYYKTELDNLNAQRKEMNKTLTAKQKELTEAGAAPTASQLAEQIKQKKESLTSLESQLAITRASQERTNTGTGMDRNQQRQELLKLEEEIKTYANAPETTSVTAPVSGRIVSVYYNPGDTVSSGSTVASIEIADKGYVCEISLPTEEARKVQVGAPCSVSNSWWYSNVEASVSQIRSDPQSQGKNRIIVIDVKGDVSEGQELKFSVGDKSQSYECVLPNSAIRQDSDGTYVLTVQSKKTPLGVRYTARRTEVSIVASDDTQSAVSGLYGSEFVITNATTPISDKQQVRLAEN